MDELEKIDMNQKKIALFTISLSRGGAERVVSLLANNLDSKFKIFLILLDKKIEYPINSNIEVFYLSTNFLRTNKLKQFFLLPKLTYKLYNYCKDNNIESILSFLPIPNFIAVSQKIFFSQTLKIIISERAFPSKYLKETNSRFIQFVNKFLIKKLYNKADIIVPNSYMIKQDLENNFDLYKPNYKVIYNPIDSVVFKPNHLKSEGSPYIFIHVGRFNKVKNHKLLINAFSRLEEINAILLLVGNGPLFGEINQLVHDLKLEQKVFFLGSRKFPEICLNNADCMILTSLFEGFPNVILEALSCGLSVISTDCKSGPREILSPNSDVNFQLTTSFEETKYGYLIPSENEDLLVESMKLIMNKSNPRALNLDAIERVKSFRVELVISEFEKILE
jgi:N-acetylgalactosamine-N,N'-diacetylbacillosaminyl-diphospho-undecaprenol 4-alpha-N-acetylgalactosaminyltransferase